jgi:hypothetical protein
LSRHKWRASFVCRNITSLKKQWLNQNKTGNGKIALERVQEKSPGVIFLDLMMPEKNTIPDSSVFFDTTFFLKLNLTY